MEWLRKGVRSLHQYGFRQTVDTAIRLVVEHFRDSYYVYTGFDYGLADAVFWPYGIDVWVRNAIVIDKLQEIGIDKTTKLLDVGAGGEGVMKVGKFCPEINDLDVVRLDIDSDSFNADDHRAIVGDGCQMPFKTNSFDIVLSIDSLEHVPRYKRSSYIEEMKRVGKDHVILHFPMTSENGEFVGKSSDIAFQQWHRKEIGYPEPNTQEHINSEHPRLVEMKKHFNSEEIHGVQNRYVWLTYMKMTRKHIYRFLTGPYYYLIGKQKDNRPPYHGCFIHQELNTQ